MAQAELRGLRKFSGWMLLVTLWVPCAFAVGMWSYPGGYEYAGHYLSAMGRTQVGEHGTNYAVALLFNGTLAVTGITVGIFFRLRALYCGTLLRWPLLFCGLAGGLLLTGIGLTPYDLAPETHDFCADYSGVLLGCALALTLFERDDIFGSRRENLLWVLMLVFLVAIWWSFHCAAQENLLPGFTTHALLQKMMVGAFWLYCFWQAINLYVRSRSRGAPR